MRRYGFYGINGMACIKIFQAKGLLRRTNCDLIIAFPAEHHSDVFNAMKIFRQTDKRYRFEGLKITVVFVKILRISI